MNQAGKSMKRQTWLFFLLLFFALFAALLFLRPRSVSAASGVEMYRMYNPNSGEHFYTASLKERKTLSGIGWRYEGIGWYAPTSGDPVYRLYNPNAGDHHYTLSKAERDYLIEVGWNDEGIGWYSAPKDQVPLYRQYNPNARTGSHNFTTSAAENDHLVSLGWRAEGIGWYAIAQGKGSTYAEDLKAAEGADQIITVGASGTYATLIMHEKQSDGSWRQVVSTDAARIGRNGLGKQQTGDKKTPVGNFRLTEAFGIKSDPGCPMGYTKVDDSHYWCCDSRSPYYNRMVSTRSYNDFNKSVSEHIIRYGDVYNYCANISYNEEQTPGRGSAIFLHCGSNATAGCVAVPESVMVQILTRLRPNCRIIIDSPGNLCYY